jgi:hypothetical protein
MVTLVRVVRDRRWPFRRAFRAVVCSLIPFGAFVFDRSLRKEMRLPGDGQQVATLVLPE